MNDQIGTSLGATIRALRRRADLSQRELARSSGVPQPTIARLESGATTNPSFRMVEELVRSTGATLDVRFPDIQPGVAVPDRTGRCEPVPHESWRDAAGRHYPAHLDVTELAAPEHWWGAWWAASTVRDRWPLELVPPCTFVRARARRDARRASEARGRAAVIRGGRVGAGWVGQAQLGDGAVVGELRAHAVAPTADEPHIPWWVHVPPDTVVLDGIVVHRAWRRRGIGRRLVQAMRADVRAAVVALTPGDSAAHRFMEVCGFRPTRQLAAPSWFVSTAGYPVAGSSAVGQRS